MVATTDRVTCGAGNGSHNSNVTSNDYTYIASNIGASGNGTVTQINGYFVHNAGTFKVGIGTLSGNTFTTISYVTISSGSGTGWQSFTSEDGDFTAFSISTGDLIMFYSHLTTHMTTDRNTNDPILGYAYASTDVMDSASFTVTNNASASIEIEMLGNWEVDAVEEPETYNQLLISTTYNRPVAALTLSSLWSTTWQYSQDYFEAFTEAVTIPLNTLFKGMGKVMYQDLNINLPYVEDLILYSNFDEGSGTIIANSADNHLHGVVQGSPTWEDGKHGGALSFDALSEYVNYGNNTAFDATSGITVAAWVWHDSTGNYDAIAGKYGINAANRSWLMYIGNAGRPNFLIVDSLAATYHTDSGGNTDTVPTGSWQHLVGTFDGRYVKIYRQGWLKFTVDRGTSDTIQVTTQDVYVGRYNTTNYFIGDIDDVIVWDRAFTAAEVRSLNQRYEETPTFNITTLYKQVLSLPSYLTRLSTIARLSVEALDITDYLSTANIIFKALVGSFDITDYLSRTSTTLRSLIEEVGFGKITEGLIAWYPMDKLWDSNERYANSTGDNYLYNSTELHWAECEATTDFTGTSLATDTDATTGTYSVKDTVTTPTADTEYDFVWNPIGTKDFSEENRTNFDFKCDRPSSAFTWARAYIHDTGGNYRYWNLEFSANEWTRMSLPTGFHSWSEHGGYMIDDGHSYTSVLECDTTTGWSGDDGNTSFAVYIGAQSEDMIRSYRSGTYMSTGVDYYSRYTFGGDQDWSSNSTLHAHIGCCTPSGEYNYMRFYIYDSDGDWAYWDMDTVYAKQRNREFDLSSPDAEAGTGLDLTKVAYFQVLWNRSVLTRNYQEIMWDNIRLDDCDTNLVDKITLNFKTADTTAFVRKIDRIYTDDTGIFDVNEAAPRFNYGGYLLVNNQLPDIDGGDVSYTVKFKPKIDATVGSGCSWVFYKRSGSLTFEIGQYNNCSSIFYDQSGSKSLTVDSSIEWEEQWYTGVIRAEAESSEDAYDGTLSVELYDSRGILIANNSRSDLGYPDQADENTLVIGNAYWRCFNNNYFNGWIKDMRIYDRPLTQAEGRYIAEGEGFSRIWTALVDFTQGISIGYTLEVIKGAVHKMTEALNLSDTLDYVTTWYRTFTHSLDLSDFLSAARSLLTNMIEAIGITDIFNIIGTWTRQSIESLIITEQTVTPSQALVKYLEDLFELFQYWQNPSILLLLDFLDVEALSITLFVGDDSFFQTSIGYKRVMDVISFTISTWLEALLVIDISFITNMVFSSFDSSIAQFYRVRSENITIGSLLSHLNTWITSIFQPTVINGYLGSQWVAFMDVSQTLNILDPVRTLVFGKNPSEELNITEYTSKIFTTIKTEVMTLMSYFGLFYPQTMIEAIVMSDVYSNISNFYRSSSEDMTLTSALRNLIGKVFTQAVSIADVPASWYSTFKRYLTETTILGNWWLTDWEYGPVQRYLDLIDTLNIAIDGGFPYTFPIRWSTGFLSFRYFKNVIDTLIINEDTIDISLTTVVVALEVLVLTASDYYQWTINRFPTEALFINEEYIRGIAQGVLTEALVLTGYLSRYTSTLLNFIQPVAINLSAMIVQWNAKRFPFESLILSDLLSPVRSIVKDIAQSINLNDYISWINTWVKSILHPIVFDNDYLTTQWDAYRTFSDVLNLSGTLDAVNSLLRVFLQTINISDYWSDVWTASNILYQDITLTDIPSRGWDALRTFAESMDILDITVDYILTIIYDVVESLNLNDSMEYLSDWFHIMSESLTHTALFSEIWSAYRLFIEVITVPDYLITYIARIVDLVQDLSIYHDLTTLWSIVRNPNEALTLLHFMSTPLFDYYILGLTQTISLIDYYVKEGQKFIELVQGIVLVDTWDRTWDAVFEIVQGWNLWEIGFSSVRDFFRYPTEQVNINPYLSNLTAWARTRTDTLDITDEYVDTVWNIARYPIEIMSLSEVIRYVSTSLNTLEETIQLSMEIETSRAIRVYNAVSTSLTATVGGFGISTVYSDSMDLSESSYRYMTKLVDSETISVLDSIAKFTSIYMEDLLVILTFIDRLVQFQREFSEDLDLNAFLVWTKDLFFTYVESLTIVAGLSYSSLWRRYPTVTLIVSEVIDTVTNYTADMREHLFYFAEPEWLEIQVQKMFESMQYSASLLTSATFYRKFFEVEVLTDVASTFIPYARVFRDWFILSREVSFNIGQGVMLESLSLQDYLVQLPRNIIKSFSETVIIIDIWYRLSGLFLTNLFSEDLDLSSVIEPSTNYIRDLADSFTMFTAVYRLWAYGMPLYEDIQVLEQRVLFGITMLLKQPASIFDTRFVTYGKGVADTFQLTGSITKGITTIMAEVLSLYENYDRIWTIERFALEVITLLGWFRRPVADVYQTIVVYLKKVRATVTAQLERYS